MNFIQNIHTANKIPDFSEALEKIKPLAFKGDASSSVTGNIVDNDLVFSGYSTTLEVGTTFPASA